MIAETFNNMRRAVKVIVLDPALVALLAEHDPKALEQLKEASADAERMYPDILAREELLGMMIKQRADEQAIDKMIAQLED